MKVKCYAIFIILVFGVSLASAQQPPIPYLQTPTPSPISELADLSFELGIAYQQAQPCQNFTVYNSLVDQYNAWVREHFGEGADALLKSKITTTNLPGAAQPQVLPEIPKQQVTQNPYSYPYMTINPFNASSDLSKFGQQQVRTDIMGEAKNIEDLSVQEKLRNFLSS
jgi:hypothetical protein